MRVYLRTFGCRANQYDTETVRAMLLAAGAELADSPDSADVGIFNSCAVTADAEADLRQSVRRAARENPALRSVVMGCAASLDATRAVSHGSAALRTLPTVSHVVPGADFLAVADALGLPPLTAGVRAARQSGTRALLRIQDGCDEHCTFCATTLARGANRSRPADDLVREASALAERHPEIVLTGIHIGSYGADCNSSLAALVERLVRDVPSVRFRLSSVEATEVDDALAELLVSEPLRVAPHLHAPLQSGSDALLKRMGRHWYTARTYAAAVERLAARAPVFGLGADVIAGFPGETDADHLATLALLRALPFTYLHVFSYSVRPGTPAERLPARVDGRTIAARAAELREVASARAAAYRASRAGGAADVIVVGEGAERTGLTGDYLSVRLADATRGRGERFAGRLALCDGGALVAVDPAGEPETPVIGSSESSSRRVTDLVVRVIE